MDKLGLKFAFQILVYPWITGLSKNVSSSVAPTLFVLGGAGPISPKSTTYQQVLKVAGVDVEVKEYPPLCDCTQAFHH